MRPAPYGYCPRCLAPGCSRERRPNGNDRCNNGHTYASSAAITKAGWIAPEEQAHPQGELF